MQQQIQCLLYDIHLKPKFKDGSRWLSRPIGQMSAGLAIVHWHEGTVYDTYELRCFGVLHCTYIYMYTYVLHVHTYTG